MQRGKKRKRLIAVIASRTDFFDHAPKLPQVLGYDGAGVIEAVGSDAAHAGWRVGDEVFYVFSPFKPGANAELQLVDSVVLARKPRTLDFVESAVLPLTYITAYEALVDRMRIAKGEQAAVFIINGAGGE
jgi:NADPH:quinone reductase-like Zn-dependent oxidoreductase